MIWQDLVAVLSQNVTHGKITTYAEVSEWAFGIRTRNQPVRSLLHGASNNGHRELTNRVIRSNGTFAELPEGVDQQRKQLVSERVLSNAELKVDMKRNVPVKLAKKKSSDA